jgi:predicted metal-dependent phosphoesterase TrpH
MTEAGYAPSVAEAFRSYLAPARGYYKEPQRLTVWEMLDFCRAVGAVSVLAHPFLNLEKERLLQFLPRAAECGLAGMECYYSLFDAATAREACEIADRFGLLRSGGSDFHGATKPDIAIGTGRGDLAVPTECYLKLRQRAV